MKKTLFSAVILFFCTSGFIFASDEVSSGFQGTPGAPIVAGCSGVVQKYDAAGDVVWTWKRGVGNMGDCQTLVNGNVLFADGDDVTEVTPEGEIVFHFVPEDQRPDSVFSAQRLDNGNTVVGWNSQNKILELDSNGKVIKTIECQFLDRINSHTNQRWVRKTAQGTYLVAQQSKGVAAEYDESGKLLRQMAVPDKAIYGVWELPDRQVLASFLDCLVIFDQDAKEIWRFSASELPDTPITYMCSLFVRKNGNIVVGNYAANRDDVHGVCMFEITPDKKLVWSYKNPEAPDSFMGVQIIE